MADISKLLVDTDYTVVEAMRKLDNEGKRILLVCKDNKLIGTVTDGDIRRFLLKGGNLSEKIINATNTKPKYVFESEINSAEKIMKVNKIFALPVVRNDMTIVSCIFSTGEEIVSGGKLNVPVVIMAGGKGTRLYPYTKILPKPLIPVGEYPILEHIMRSFSKYGCNDFICIVNHKKEMIKAYFSENETFNNVLFVNEDKPLGTGGGLSLLKGKLDSTFFLTNCDILVRTDFNEILNFHKKNKNVITMVCAYQSYKVPYGVIEMGQNGFIDDMVEKPEYTFLTNTGMYIVEPNILDDIEDDVPIGFTDIITREKNKGNKVSVFPISEKSWLDMGQMDSLENMRKELDED